ncbi:MAG: VCBS repeat-containing protein, partial [Planctomycetes bacterium]|nr:VCBS repeat-containing protein [Planctomycetota bacterium]
DFDLDGDLDLVQGCATIGPPIQVQSVGRGTDVRLLWNDGNGTLRDGFRSDLPAAPGNASGREAAVADLNGDGAADLVIAGSDNAVYYNDGVARFSRSAQMFPVGGGSVVLGDLDGDGDADCVLFAADQLWTLQNDGVGSLITWQGPYTTPETIVDVAIGDVDGDGAPDLFVAQVAPGIGPFNPMTPAVDQVWLGQGNGAFALASGWTTTPTTPSDVALADLDGDGDLDVLDPHFVQIQANGSFAVTPIPGPFTGIARLALGDLDGDGDLDGVVATRCSICGGGFDDPVNGLLRNDGAGVFTAVAWPQTNFRGSYGVAVGDLDGDGDDDALFGNGSVNQWYDQVVTNLGGGQWSFGPATIDGEEEDDTRQVLLADLDRDGDLDYFAWCAPTPQAGPVRSRVFRNYTRQLAAPLPPRLGRDYDLEAHGAPLGAGVWLALQPALVQTPFGVLGIGPLGLAPLVTLPAPATGTVARTSFVLPAAPSLAGLTIYLQAIDFASLRLSNALHETFVGW